MFERKTVHITAINTVSESKFHPESADKYHHPAAVLKWWHQYTGNWQEQLTLLPLEHCHCMCTAYI
jgi:hypothetical protein